MKLETNLVSTAEKSNNVDKLTNVLKVVDCVNLMEAEWKWQTQAILNSNMNHAESDISRAARGKCVNFGIEHPQDSCSWSSEAPQSLSEVKEISQQKRRRLSTSEGDIAFVCGVVVLCKTAPLPGSEKTLPGL